MQMRCKSRRNGFRSKVAECNGERVGVQKEREGGTEELIRDMLYKWSK